MDLKNNKVTVGELMEHPGARAVLQRRFPMLMKHPVMGAARTITLEQILAVAREYAVSYTHLTLPTNSRV